MGTSRPTGPAKPRGAAVTFSTTAAGASSTVVALSRFLSLMSLTSRSPRTSTATVLPSTTKSMVLTTCEEATLSMALTSSTVWAAGVATFS